jgi:hypothetical protein
MSDQNYEPPRAPVQDPPGPGKTRSNLLAIILGASVDLLATTIGGVILGLAFAVAAGAGGMTPEQMQSQMADSDFYRILASALGLACSVFGGYVCARFANQNEYANALAVGAIGVAMGELLTGGAGDAWQHMLGLATIPAALLGAHFKMRRDKR